MRNILFVVFIVVIAGGAGWVFFKKDQAADHTRSGGQTETEGAGALSKAVVKSDRPILEFRALLITVAAAKMGEKSGEVYGQSGGGVAGTSQNEGLGFSRQMLLFSVRVEMKDDDTLALAKADKDKLKTMFKENISDYYLEKAQKGLTNKGIGVKEDNAHIAIALKAVTEDIVGAGSVVEVTINNAMDRE
jgi:hypothetical protein